MWRFKVLSVPLDFSGANFCPLNSGPLDLNRLKINDDILNRLKCQNVNWQKHITEEPIRKHFMSMSWTVVSSKLGVNFITIIVYYVLLKCSRNQLLEVQIEHLFAYNTNAILLVIYIIFAEPLGLTSQKLYWTTIIWF